ncbi:MAG: DUF190 domain-containing protein [Candidatus Gastranaerophilales bacterium]|nr:DUF190 domain-containing protein [Candidatus Gastranaerophilales bacterium]
MIKQGDVFLLRIFLGENDMDKGKPLYEQIVLKAHSLSLAGVTVLRGIMGFGARSHLHSAKVMRLSENLPVVVEIVDTRQNLKKLFPFLEPVINNALITLEKITVINCESDL